MLLLVVRLVGLVLGLLPKVRLSHIVRFLEARDVETLVLDCIMVFRLFVLLGCVDAGVLLELLAGGTAHVLVEVLAAVVVVLTRRVPQIEPASLRGSCGPQLHVVLALQQVFRLQLLLRALERALLLIISLSFYRRLYCVVVLLLHVLEVESGETLIVSK